MQTYTMQSFMIKQDNQDLNPWLNMEQCKDKIGIDDVESSKEFINYLINNIDLIEDAYLESLSMLHIIKDEYPKILVQIQKYHL